MLELLKKQEEGGSMFGWVDAMSAWVLDGSHREPSGPSPWEVAVMLMAGLPPPTGDPEADARTIELYYRCWDVD